MNLRAFFTIAALGLCGVWAAQASGPISDSSRRPASGPRRLTPAPLPPLIVMTKAQKVQVLRTLNLVATPDQVGAPFTLSLSAAEVPGRGGISSFEQPWIVAPARPNFEGWARFRRDPSSYVALEITVDPTKNVLLDCALTLGSEVQQDQFAFQWYAPDGNGQSVPAIVQQGHAFLLLPKGSGSYAVELRDTVAGAGAPTTVGTWVFRRCDVSLIG